MRVLLDTNICIYLIKNHPPKVRQYFERYNIGEIGISTITIAELEYGVQKSKEQEKNRNALIAFLEMLPKNWTGMIGYLSDKGKRDGKAEKLLARVKGQGSVGGFSQ